jgi:hypothetical protein
MNTPVRSLVGLLLLAILVAGGILLMRGGLYGLTIFIMLPMLLGALASWVFRPATERRAAVIGAAATAIATGSLLLLGVEGLICIAMTLPLAVPLGALGGWAMYRAQHSEPAKRGGVAMMLLLTPTGITWDTQAKPSVFELHTAITIAAPPEKVWKYMVTFPDMPEPREWFFRAGLAYPQRVRLEGSGVGAIRYCEFSTGRVVEPIEVWDEPRLLRFRVTENAPPMHEWSPYDHLAPKHLHGYLISKEGEFRLTRLPNNRTMLEGTSWYQHGLWPAQYWRWWSDAIIHRIHLRVLNHIRTLAEGGS